MAYDEELAFRIRNSLSDERGITEKRMFGGLAFLVGGHLAVAVSGQGGIMLRCDPSRTDELLDEPGAFPMEMRGKTLSGWLRVDDLVLENDATLRGWVDRGVSYAGTLPPKS